MGQRVIFWKGSIKVHMRLSYIIPLALIRNETAASPPHPLCHPRMGEISHDCIRDNLLWFTLYLCFRCVKPGNDNCLILISVYEWMSMYPCVSVCVCVSVIVGGDIAMKMFIINIRILLRILHITKILFLRWWWPWIIYSLTSKSGKVHVGENALSRSSKTD